ncbi:hypothetical protein [Flavobacterium rhizosphaerae]|uniref:Pentapeptide repeat-containing protein n=1 Tax=Flavobacterium rhizosphaerae TaxID=3163298 RepID=A0ABW8YYL4_9FLAO
MTVNELRESISVGKRNFSNQKFTSNISIKQGDLERVDYCKFYDCIFERKLILKDLNSRTIKFQNCTFNNSVTFENCNLHELSITGIKSIKELRISDSIFNSVRLNSSDFINSDFFLINNYIRVDLNCSEMMINSGKFIINSRDKNENSTIKADFRNSFFDEFILLGNLNELLFQGSRIKKLSFEHVNVNKAYFKNSEFGKEALFYNCNFNFNVSFSNIKCKIGEFRIQICTVKGNSYFNNAVFDKLFISDTVFESRSSFNNVAINHFELYLVNFLKPVYFDELKIGIIKDCNRATLRTIKQELQKTDNRIDYNRFRGYELQAYYKELKWNGNFRDKFILGATWLATGFDHSWRKALAFTIFFGLFWYSILYFWEYHGAFDITEINTYFVGAFRFFLITNFSSPFDNGEYLKNAAYWLPFVFGKIFIAFGIYEMIQAFRKFKV